MVSVIDHLQHVLERGRWFASNPLIIPALAVLVEQIDVAVFNAQIIARQTDQSLDVVLFSVARIFENDDIESLGLGKVVDEFVY